MPAPERLAAGEIDVFLRSTSLLGRGVLGEGDPSALATAHHKRRLLFMSSGADR